MPSDSGDSCHVQPEPALRCSSVVVSISLIALFIVSMLIYIKIKWVR